MKITEVLACQYVITIFNPSNMCDVIYRRVRNTVTMRTKCLVGMSHVIDLYYKGQLSALTCS